MSLLGYRLSLQIRCSLIALILLLTAALPAYAATINVDSGCTLAQAINEANGASKPTGVTCEDGTDGSGAAGADKIILSANVSVTAQLPTITSHVTINGGSSVRGYTIDHTGDINIETSADSNLTLEYIAISGGGAWRGDKASLELGGPATLNQVRMFSNRLLAIRAKGEGAVYSFTNVIIDGVTGWWSYPIALWLAKGQATLTNVAFLGLIGGTAMVRVDSGAQLTFAGCKTVSRVLNKTITGSGTVIDNSSGDCPSEFRANGEAIPFRPVQNPWPALPCGFPSNGWVNVPDNAGLLDFVLSGNCVVDGPLFIPSGVSMRIRSPEGQRYSITARQNNRLIAIAGELTLVNVELIGPADDTINGVRLIEVYTPGKLDMRNLIMRRPDGATMARLGVRLFAGEASFTNVTFSNFLTTFDTVASAISVNGGGKVTIRDSTFRGNTGGRGAIAVYDNVGGYVRLLGMNTYSDNSPQDTHDPHGLFCEGEACTGTETVTPTNTHTPTPTDTLTPNVTCQRLSPAVAVSNLSSGTACNLVLPSGYGHPDLQAAMPLSVVDVWGWVTPNTRVCFRAASGSIKFVDTTATPRTIADLPAFGLNGMVCADIPGAGQVALIAGPRPPSFNPAAIASAAPPFVAAPPAAKALSGCMVRSNYILNLRDAPSGEVIGAVPYYVTLTALQRTPSWFKVDNLGQQGWVAANVVTPIGTCA